MYVKPSHAVLGWGKFCSIECRTKAQFTGKIFLCFICGIETYRSKAKALHSKSGHIFCSKSCQTQWRNTYFIEEKHANWLNGKSIYRKILLKSNCKQLCIGCGISDKRILIVHHIDHDRTNNKVQNLTWACHNCHYLIHSDSQFECMIKNKLKNMVPIAQLV